MIKMSENEDDILLEAEDKVATLKEFIDKWHKASDNSERTATIQYCLGRAHGLEVCLPLIKKLEEKISKLILEEIDLQLEQID